MIASLNYNVPPPLFPISSARTKRSAADAASNAIVQEWTQLASGYWQGHDTAEAYFNAHIDDIFALRIKATRHHHDWADYLDL